MPEVVAFPLRNYDWQRLSPQPSGPATLAPAVEANDAALWRGFLKQRYSTIASLNLAHATNFNGFASVTLPVALLPASAALDDWNDYVESKSAGWSEFGEQSLGTVPVSAEDAPVRKFPLTAAQLGAGDMVEIRLIANRTFVPALEPSIKSGDARELGVRVFHAFVQPGP